MSNVNYHAIYKHRESNVYSKDQFSNKNKSARMIFSLDVIIVWKPVKCWWCLVTWDLRTKYNNEHLIATSLYLKYQKHYIVSWPHLSAKRENRLCIHKTNLTSFSIRYIILLLMWNIQLDIAKMIITSNKVEILDIYSKIHQ